MGYFNPILYFIRSFIRIFTKKFFWVILICVCLFLGFILFNTNDVFGSSYTTEEIISNNMYYLVQQLVNETHLPNTDTDSYKYLITNQGEVIITKANGYLWVNSNNSGKFALGGCYYISTTELADSSTVFNCVWNKWNDAGQGGEAFSNLNTTTIYSSFGYNNTPTLTFEIASTPPYIVNDTNTIIDWSFDTLNISLGSISYDSSNSYFLRYTLNSVDYFITLKDYYNNTLGYFVIPRSQLTNDIIVRDNDTFEFALIYRTATTLSPYELGTFTISITSENQQQINQDSEKALQGQILNQQQQTNEKLDNLNNTQQQTNNKLDNLDNTINDSSVDDITSNTLPSDSTPDITSEGVNGIFTSIYNAFCTGQAQDIVFPIPFTNKNITLQANYVSNMLTSSGAGWVITIIQAFWWYLISRFIIKDVMNKINKIKSGNIEDIETTNIRGDML